MLFRVCKKNKTLDQLTRLKSTSSVNSSNSRELDQTLTRRRQKKNAFRSKYFRLIGPFNYIYISFVKVSLSPDIILCGRLGSKHQPTNFSSPTAPPRRHSVCMQAYRVCKWCDWLRRTRASDPGGHYCYRFAGYSAMTPSTHACQQRDCQGFFSNDRSCKLL